MPKLSLCIPVTPDHELPLNLVGMMLQNANSDVEIILSCMGDRVAESAALNSSAATDARLKLLPPAPLNLSAAQLWIGTLAAAKGDWVSLANPDDMIDADLPLLLDYVEETQPDADALAWSAFQIDPELPTSTSTNVAIPVLHNVTEFDKAPLLEAFFHWKDAGQTPKMPWGLYHGALRRSLVDTILANCGELAWLTVAPQYEWAARVLIFANKMALSNRPLSAISSRPFQSRPIPSALEGFPFTAGLGLTGAIAEIQARVLADLGSQWQGFGEDFVRACMYDCAFETNAQAFQAKCDAYRQALAAFPGGQAYLAAFQPPYSPVIREDHRRGLHGKTFLVDRFLGKAVTAQDFYTVVNHIMTPVWIVTKGEIKLVK
ncbi:hypothetical protein ACQ3G6_16440 [Allorhizobium undicola]|uniref:hypothetical protein n=1 Tax=Allorhizobium undicola TaxID=78527 RepID=UPI003D340E05